MNTKDTKYTKYSLASEMLQTPGIIAKFDFKGGSEAEAAIKKHNGVFFTGEGSSRIFPAKNFMYQAMRCGAGVRAATDGSRQAMEYQLKDFAVFGASNSGKTKEVVSLFRDLGKAGHKSLFSLSAFANTPLGDASTGAAYVLSCGKEEAVAATKSVVEQGLFYHAILDRMTGTKELPSQAAVLAKNVEQALTLQIDGALVEKLAKANILHWAGRNNGVAEELTLKTNEITRKRSAYLEGTYAVHGIEEVMSAQDAVIVVDPYEAEEEKFEEVLVKGVGCTVVALATRQTRFPTIKLPSLAGLETYIQLCAGWNLLVEIGCCLGINMDKTERARKVGNELKK